MGTLDKWKEFIMAKAVTQLIFDRVRAIHWKKVSLFKNWC